MSAGDDLLGESLAGEDGIVWGDETPEGLDGGLYFDGNTRDFPLDADGQVETIHPVDSEVLAALLVEAKKVPAANDVGHTLREINSGAGPRVKSDVENRVKKALRSLLQRNAISIRLIECELVNEHTLVVGVTYINLITTAQKDVAMLMAA
jgi:hypothetical protein